MKLVVFGLVPAILFTACAQRSLVMRHFGESAPPLTAVALKEDTGWRIQLDLPSGQDWEVSSPVEHLALVSESLPKGRRVSWKVSNERWLDTDSSYWLRLRGGGLDLPVEVRNRSRAVETVGNVVVFLLIVLVVVAIASGSGGVGSIPGFTGPHDLDCKAFQVKGRGEGPHLEGILLSQEDLHLSFPFEDLEVSHSEPLQWTWKIPEARQASRRPFLALVRTPTQSLLMVISVHRSKPLLLSARSLPR